MKIGAKIYYDKETGQVIWIIGERSGEVIETTRDQDFKAYTALSERVSETVGLLQLEYGDYEADYDEGGVIIRIDLETMEPLFTYPEPESVDPETPQEPRPALSKQVEVLIQDNALLKAQSKALAERASFTEDVIAEIAIEVYK